jgi:hypothetical protein
MERVIGLGKQEKEKMIFSLFFQKSVPNDKRDIEHSSRLSHYLHCAVLGAQHQKRRGVGVTFNLKLDT